MPITNPLHGPRSIRYFAMLFLLLAVIVILTILAFSLYSVQRVNDQLEIVKIRAAQQEIALTLAALRQRMTVQMEQVAAWDETRPQLSNPVYYPYWKEHRLLSNPVLPDHLLDADLYHPDGTILVKYQDKGMPKHIDGHIGIHAPDFSLNSEGHLLAFYPIMQNDASAEIEGYVGLMVDFLPLLRDQVVSSIQPQSLSLKPLQGAVPLMDSVHYLDFMLPENRDLQELVKVVRGSLMLLVLAIFGLSVVFYWAARRLVARPMLELVQHIHSLQESSNGSITMSRPLPLSELDQVRLSLNEYQLRLTQVHQNLDQKNQELWDLAFHDALTGCFNRRAFDEHWHSLLSSLPSSRLNVSMILFDCNHFKALNDTYGHQVGDSVLKAIADSILKSLRLGDNLYRIGGDEFVLILLDADDDSADHLATRCLERIGQYDFYQFGIDEPVRVGVGISSTVSDKKESLIALHWQADIAMYHAKRPGNRPVVHFTQEMSHESGSVLSNRIIVAVHQAITVGDNLIIYYQPIIKLSNNRVEYYEALVRIRDGDQIISPSDIFQIVESRRLEQDFDQAVFGCILRDLEAGRVPEGTGISINISGPSVVDERMMEWFEPFVPFINRYKLQIEVTETSLIRQLHLASQSLNRLREMGFLVALDDFGSGYSSLRYLASMPVDLIKFDITMIRELEEDSQQRTVIEGLAEAIMQAGFPLVAEGVEHEAMLERVRELGFHYAQGYLIGHPESSQTLFETEQQSWI